MSDEELDRLQSLCDAASSGPWDWMSAEDSETGSDRIFLLHTCDYPGSLHEGLGHKCPEECGWAVLQTYCPAEEDTEGERADNRPSHDDAAFIAAARTALPSLIAEVRRLRDEINRVGPYLAIHGVSGYSIGPLVPYGSPYEEAAP